MPCSEKVGLFLAKCMLVACQGARGLRGDEWPVMGGLRVGGWVGFP